MTVHTCHKCGYDYINVCDHKCAPTPGLFGNQIQDEMFNKIVRELYKIIADNAKSAREHVKAVENRVEQTNENVSHSRRLIGNIQTQLEKLEEHYDSEIEATDENVAENDKEINKLFTRIGELEEMFKITGLCVDNSHATDAKAYYMGLAPMSQLIKQVNEDLKREHNKLNPSRAHLEKVLAEKNARIKELKEVCEMQHERLINGNEALRNECNQLKSALDDMRKQRDMAMNTNQKPCQKICCLPPSSHYVGCCL